MSVFYISDTHFNHTNIIKYCNRPFKDAETMNAALIKRWNTYVSKEDIVYHLGDFAMGNKEQITDIVGQLNGKIKLIKGNHDTHNNQWYRDCGFDEVYDHPIIIKDFVVLSHEPLPFVINQMYVNLFGHVHDSPMFETWGSQYACLCVERHQYYPVKEETIIEHFIGGK
jgi:calcineurin-like phosphoesterase family protein